MFPNVTDRGQAGNLFSFKKEIKIRKEKWEDLKVSVTGKATTSQNVAAQGSGSEAGQVPREKSLPGRDSSHVSQHGPPSP